ncbi:MAG: phosphoribosylamine--glycine ligase [Prevotella sp.]|nr:phosphoribosylamine--glycine ligase [Bacteroides sp.]MCM1366240.1 phosphoribosylamine--glycine ligase [Prevotella sp.]MCM1436355.1 phosphoribosylamine--glycine ligase [Prevotella sp.]
MKERLNILLLGSGARESAFADKILQSPRTERLYVAPGNAGTAEYNVSLSPLDFDGIKEFVDSHAIDMIVVGPEQPLVDGIADYFAEDSVKVIGPGKAGAMLEGSKEYAKEFMFRHAIPTARFMTVTGETVDEGLSFLESLKAPYVLKADGLAAGKGVLIIDSLMEAKEKLTEMLGGMFGEASCTVVIEEYLDGVECSVFVMTDGEDYIILPVAKDYKRIGEGDTGLNTGGMGAVSPVPFADESFMDRVRKSIIEPTIKGLREEGVPYSGFIFLGLMNVDGYPMVIEYNCRMGDPETEVVLPRIESDFVSLLEGIADKTLALKKLKVTDKAAATVILAAEGYPEKYRKGDVITGFENLDEDVKVYHAGTKYNESNEIITNGGRVLAVTVLAEDIHKAALRATQAAATLEFEGKQFRRDISQDL